MAWSPRRDACLVPASLAFSFGMSGATTNPDHRPYCKLNRYLVVASKVAEQGRACDSQGLFGQAVC